MRHQCRLMLDMLYCKANVPKNNVNMVTEAVTYFLFFNDFSLIIFICTILQAYVENNVLKN